jgi:hypothetical protein
MKWTKEKGYLLLPNGVTRPANSIQINTKDYVPFEGYVTTALESCKAKETGAGDTTVINALKELRIYFGEHDKTIREHAMYAIADNAIKNLLQPSSLPAGEGVDVLSIINSIATQATSSFGGNLDYKIIPNKNFKQLADAILSGFSASTGEQVNKILDIDIPKEATEYSERVCNGKFPIEYTREQVVNHTKNDFIEGANLVISTYQKYNEEILFRTSL